ncbi:DUF4097 family beta strand repeat protein [bacterium]|nr:DUF4097 family beta strand repeat protein [bacterium]
MRINRCSSGGRGSVPVILIALSIALLLTLTALPAIAMSGVPDDAKASAENIFHQEESAAGIDKIEIETINGSIEVTGYDGDQIIVDATYKVRGRDQDVCNELLEKVRIEVKINGEVLKIEPKTKDKKGYSVSVHFEVKAPSHIALEAEIISGSIEVADINGGAELETINGDIECSNMTGEVSCETINGSIDFKDVTEELNAETINGSISAENGSISPATIDFGTINGTINIKLQKTPDASLSASTMNGKVRIKGVSNIELKKGARSFNATLGTGEGDYSLSTINGSILVEVEAAE